MGKLDICSKTYTRRSEIVADLVNYIVYDGKQTIREEDITEKDTTELAMPYKKDGEKLDILMKDRLRDVLKRCSMHETANAAYLIIGIENQAKIHYAMCVRNMFMDAMNYATQVEKIAKRNRNFKHYDTEDEFLSGITKADKLKPIVTLVVYWGEEKWDAARSIHEMLDGNEEILKYVADYKLNLIIPDEIEDFDKFHTKIGKIFKLMKCRSDKKKFVEALENEEDFYGLDNVEKELIRLTTSFKIPERIAKGEREIMCKAVEDLKEEGRQEERAKMQNAVEQIKEEGRQEERAKMQNAVEQIKEEGRQEERAKMQNAVEQIKEEGRQEERAKMQNAVEQIKEEGRQEERAKMQNAVEQIKEEGRQEERAKMQNAVEQIKEEGRQEERAKMQNAVEQIKEEGRQEERAWVIQKLLKSGMNVSDIAERMGFSIEKVFEIQKSI